MVILLIILSALVLVLLFRLLFIKKELNSITTNLNRIRLTETKEKVTITLGDQTVEQLAKQINYLIEDKHKSQKDAIRTERQLTEMIASMSHDLRTPLTAIIGYLQLLAKEEISPEDHTRYITITQARANQLHALIQSFFALSTIQEGKESLHLEPVQIDQLIKKRALTYYDAFEQDKKHVDIHIPEKVSTVIGDVVACNRIIENILLNAMQHAEKEITIRLLENKDTVLFTVENTIQSIKKPDPDRLFERLYTQDSSRQTHRGLGLPIVERLMEQMDGRVFVVIEKGTFSITCEWKKLNSSSSL